MVRAVLALIAITALGLAPPSADARRRRASAQAADTIWIAGERFPAPRADAERVLLIGDSNFFGPLGHTLRKDFLRKGYHVKLRGKPSSGLARPEFFDWFAEAERLIEEFRPTLVIAMLGANDVQRITWPQFGDRVQWDEEARWRRAYAGRYREFARFLSARVPEVVLLSPTNRGWDSARAAVTRVREVQRRAVRGLPGVHWIDMFPLSSNEDGSWLSTGEDARGKRIWYRQPDRIHLTKAGGKVVGTRVLEVLGRTSLRLAQRTR